MSTRFLFGAAVLVLSFGAAQAAEPATPGTAKSSISLGKHDSNAPISVSSDNFEGDLETKVGTYTGNVIITQGDYKLRADRVNVHVVDGKPSTIDGSGNVLFNSGTESASGDTGVYDLNAKTITLDGKVVLSKEKNVMRGSHLVMNLDTNKAILTAKGTTGGGRVQGLFMPPQKDKSSSAKSQTKSKSHPK